MNVRWLNRHNVCQMAGSSSSGAHFRRSPNVFPCFHRAFSFIDSHPNETYTITYRLHIRKKCDGIKNNFACLSKKDMCRLLNSFKMIIPFTYHFEETKFKYIVELNLEGTCYQHKGLLMLSRSLFEFPHNLCGFDAIKMRDAKSINGVDFTKIPLYNLYLTGISSTEHVGDECFICSNNVKLLSTSDLREKLRDIHNGRISRVMPYNGVRRARINLISDDSEFQTDAKFLTRVSIYINNYEKSLHE